MTQQLSLLSGSGSVSGTTTYTSSTTADQIVTVVTLPKDPGYIYDVYLSGTHYCTTRGSSTNICAMVAGRSKATNLLELIFQELFQGSSQPNNLSFKAAPGETIKVYFKTYSGGIVPSNPEYYIRYNYVGKAINSGDF